MRRGDERSPGSNGVERAGDADAGRHRNRFAGVGPTAGVFESWRERAETLEAEVYALYLALRDARTPLAAKGVIALVVAYAASPVDPIPDVLPVVGYLDELVVLPLGVALALRLTPDPVLEECRRRAEEEIDVGRAR